jgi:hypothetical protein
MKCLKMEIKLDFVFYLKEEEELFIPHNKTADKSVCARGCALFLERKCLDLFSGIICKNKK